MIPVKFVRFHVLSLHLFSFSLYSSRLVSNIVGTSLQCGTEACDTGNVNLMSPVTIIFEHFNSVMVSHV